jgi:hypothetical protein
MRRGRIFQMIASWAWFILLQRRPEWVQSCTWFRAASCAFGSDLRRLLARALRNRFAAFGGGLACPVQTGWHISAERANWDLKTVYASLFLPSDKRYPNGGR